MGLDCSHDAFHGAYSAFNRFRQAVAAAIGASFPPHWEYGPGGTLIDGPNSLAKRKDGFDDDYIYWDDDYQVDAHPGMMIFFSHSDCEGEISPSDCVLVANELEAVLPKIASLGWEAGGHIAARGGFVAVTEKFIAGCRAAAAEGVPLEFH